MTNEEFYTKKIDEEYQKYLKNLKIPSREEWMKMEHKEEIKHKFNVGDCICSYKFDLIVYKVKRVLQNGTYELEDENGNIDKKFIKNIDERFSKA